MSGAVGLTMADFIRFMPSMMALLTGLIRKFFFLDTSWSPDVPSGSKDHVFGSAVFIAK